ncbi:hypothetical protein PTTG_26502 [Puccinia triticina 1-1 BBBD Race 1]|uniref:Uncharacterized protein n=1 Tax=Puccinia triticina (isolate 1-1 / race 1 (BBBD)) TaxID=630390 RepID=A0A180GTN1_PUCT1|nr:hypothetical protein PTTG_26502 [Puccinia triticina 1-1 BBBD Race 1]
MHCFFVVAFFLAFVKSALAIPSLAPRAEVQTTQNKGQSKSECFGLYSIGCGMSPYYNPLWNYGLGYGTGIFGGGWLNGAYGGGYPGLLMGGGLGVGVGLGGGLFKKDVSDSTNAHNNLA